VVPACLLACLKGYYGGVLNTGMGPMTMTNTKFINNTATAGGQGGTIYAMDPKDSEFTNCTWLNNSAYQGAGIYASRYGGKADWTLTRCNFTGNTADQKGAGIYTTGMNFTFVGTRISWNKALLGAGVYASSSGTSRPVNMLFSSCTLQHNTAEQSAGVAWLTGYAQAAFSNCSISNNHAGQSAGGLYLQDTPARLDGCVLAGNSARMAGAVMQQGSESAVKVVRTRFVNNQVCRACRYEIRLFGLLVVQYIGSKPRVLGLAGGRLA
jgi:predicted outer membrane repeat protein